MNDRPSMSGDPRLSRRSLLKGVAASAGLALLAACGGGEATTAPTAAPAGGAAPTTAAAAGAPTTAPRTGAVTVNWFSQLDQTGYTDKAVADFNAKNSALQITYQVQGATTTDLRDKFAIIAQAKDPVADVVSMDVPFVPEWAAAGWTVAVDDLLPASERSKFFEGTITGATYEGKLFGVPWYNNGPGLFYRKDLLDAKGLQPPKTYDELLSQSKQLITPEVPFGFVAQTSQTEGGLITWLEHLWGYGGDVVDNQLKISLDRNSAGVDALQRLINFVYTDKIMPESTLTMNLGGDAETPFREGKAVFLRLWLTSANALQAANSAVKDKWAVAPLPSQSGQAAGPGCLGTWNLGISAFSKKQNEAKEVIRYMTTLEEGKSRYLANGNLPARPAIFEDPEVRAKYPYAANFGPVFNALKPRPVTPYYSQMSADAMRPNFGAAMTRQKTPDQAIKDMTSALKQIVPS